ncbi:protein-methionine-sulfoxide reductase heme-binding subunit MsrQ [Xinfangfangia pollutisoli]|uniref:protein-methionine-sulfoxide reductase heme-binding subunit MsrQ n=1 Tax=Xinfangfangia pollutisoli TaxID=2865960 RepID=UPI001CD49E44|nr:protein-methionine-sulfoxide reductase heme-binding subunit MsrQ [Xinfangfangia pollutisoli]
MDRINALLRRLPEPAVWLLGAVPLALLIWGAVFGGLGPDPVKAIEHDLGQWALRFLLASLAVTPLRWLGLNLIRHRRALGLLAFSYAVLHLVAWLWLDMGLRLGQAAGDLVKRPYIIAGMLGLLAMLPLALTSTRAAIRRMGRNWQRLHRLAYAALVLGLLHFALLLKVWTPEILIYMALGGGLLGARAVRSLWPRRPAAGAPARVAR